MNQRLQGPVRSWLGSLWAGGADPGAAVTALYPWMVLTWVLAVPMAGVAAAGGPSGLPWQAFWFCLGLVPGTALLSSACGRRPELARGGAWAAAVAAGLLTLGAALIPVHIPYLWLPAMGLSAAAGFVAWAAWTARTASVNGLGRTLAGAVAAAVVAAWLLVGAAESAGRGAAALLLSLPPVAAAVALSVAARSSGAVGTFEGGRPRVGDGLPGLQWALAVLLFGLVGGLGFRTLLSASFQPGADATGGWIAVPFAAGVVVAGHWLEKGKRESVTLLGAALLLFPFVPALAGARWGQDPLVAALEALGYGLLAFVPWSLLLAAMDRQRAVRLGGWGPALLAGQMALGLALSGLPEGLTGGPLSLLAAFLALVATVIAQGPANPRGTLLARQAWDAGEREAAEHAGEGASAVSQAVLSALERLYGEKLTRREMETARLAVMGVPTREIAERLFLTPSTVKTHLKNLYRKTGTANRNDLYRKLLAAEFSDLSAEAGQEPVVPAAPVAPRVPPANRDVVTGLPSRAAFDAVIGAELSQSRVLGRPLSLILLRLEALAYQGRRPNRTEHHQALMVVAGLLTTSLRSGDTVFRWSTEEFLVLLPGTGLLNAREVGTRLMLKVGSWVESRGMATTIRVGCASTDEGMEDREALLGQALRRLDAREKQDEAPTEVEVR